MPVPDFPSTFSREPAGRALKLSIFPTVKMTQKYKKKNNRKITENFKLFRKVQKFWGDFPSFVF